MERINDILKSKLVPTHALIFYKPNIVMEENGAFVEHREIKNGKMGAAEPLEIKTLVRIMKTVEKYTKTQVNMSYPHGEIPENLLYSSSDLDCTKLVWYRKPEVRKMFFAESLGIPNGEIMVPGIVYMAKGNSLSVYAFKGSKPKGWLYMAPFFNVSDSVCLGSAKVQKPKENTFVKWIEYWETMFWKSEFVHILGTNPTKGNLATITKDCIINNKVFPMNELIKSKITLKSLFV